MTQRAGTPQSSSARDEFSRLLVKDGAPRALLRGRIQLFVGLGIVIGALHLFTGRGGSTHIAISAALAALVPIFAPLCFVPATLESRDRGAAPWPVAAVRVAIAIVFGWVVAAVHLLVWVVLVKLTGGLSGPTASDIPFMLATVAVTGIVASMAFEAPLRESLARPMTTAIAVVLYVIAFLVHGLLLEPSLGTLRQHYSPTAGVAELLSILVAIVVIWFLLRREVHATQREGHRA